MPNTALSDHDSGPTGRTLWAMMVVSALLGGLVALALFTALRPTELQADSPRAELPRDFVAVADEVRPVVVNINTEQEIRRQYYGFDIFSFDPFSDDWPPFRPYTRTQKVSSLGSGVIIDPEGIVLTNAHVIGGAQKISVTLQNGASYPARLVSDALARTWRW